MGNDTIIEIWKQSRGSVEHFDKILGDFRKILFAIYGVIVTGAVSIMLSQLSDKLLYISLLGFGLNIITLLIWFCEKHYHLYLVISSRVAKEAESALQIDSSLQLTHKLGEGKKREQRGIPFKKYINYYDMIYLIPACGVLGVLCFVPMSSNWAKWLLIIEIPIIIFILIKQYLSENAA